MQTESTPRMDNEDKSSYAEFKIQKSSVKWLVVFAVVLFVAFLGLLLASVLISTNITKDVQVQNGQLVSSKDKSTVIKTSDMTYTQKVTLDTPLEVVETVKYITVYIEKSGSITPSVFRFQVTGFKRIPGRQLVFHGHTHSANILADGTVKVIQTYLSNNKREVQIRDGLYAEIEALLSGANPPPVLSIYQCSDLTNNFNPTGFYRLENNVSCTLSAPLPSFSGYFNGNNFYFTLNINRPDGEVALFQEIHGGAVFNLNVDGNLIGAERCAVFAVQVLPGSRLVSNRALASVTCSPAANSKRSANGILVAAIAAEVVNSSPPSTADIVFEHLLSGAFITVPEGSAGYQGGIFAIAPQGVSIVSRNNYFLSFFNGIANSNNLSPIGNTINGQKKRTPCGNPNDPDYNSFCWRHFNYSSSTGQAHPYDDFFDCCEGWNPCTGCMYDVDVWGCQFVLCTPYGKKKRDVEDVDVNVVKRYINLPLVVVPNNTPQSPSTGGNRRSVILQ